ncbi:hypothetical protein [Catellatospora sichuanensis]|uniref:hypothetical protein n=1 Tax=Catellatospora sichuanensis TaxID=1969805 RepID=UPI00118302AE|nr:hypothetical protein [Catellatospora sichuanensis]
MPETPLSKIVSSAARVLVAGRLPLRAVLGTTRADVIAMVVDAHERLLHASDLPALDPRATLPLDDVRRSVVELTDPVRSLRAVFGARIKRPPGAEAADDTDPVQWAPSFPEPMWRSLSNDWLLAGLDNLPPDTACVALTNAAFVRSYLVGANHEFARELRWREYPTDQRGTYFAVFWGSGPDVAPLHTWPADTLLDDSDADADRIVLLLRSALLRRYPGAVIYAAPVTGTGADRQPDDGRACYPMFRGALDAETTFIGFDLPEQVLLDSPWCFVIAEQPCEPRFGIDSLPPADDTPAFAAPPVGNSAAAAGFYFQQPVRLVLPAARLLSPSPGAAEVPARGPVTEGVHG